MHQTASQLEIGGDDASRHAGAVFSRCGRYRYRLWRRWAEGQPCVVWLMLNPSTADALALDPTVTRCLRFAKRWGCGSMEVLNLYGLRSTDPAGLWVAEDPVGPETDAQIDDVLQAMLCSERLIVAWGAHAKPDRVAAVMSIIRARLHASQVGCLGLTKRGQPRHPLYIRGDTQPVELVNDSRKIGFR
jgi:hypothetical protein